MGESSQGAKVEGPHSSVINNSTSLLDVSFEVVAASIPLLAVGATAVVEEVSEVYVSGSSDVSSRRQ